MAVVNYGRTLVELGRMARRMEKPEGGLKRVGQYLKGLTQQAFRDGRDPTTGDAWAKLKPATLKQRRKGGGRVQILVNTSVLRKSIVAIITGRNKVAVGTPQITGKFHMWGTKFMDARRFLGFDKRGEKEIPRIMKRWILGER
jgi:phage virion morphogenesis protein